MENSVFRFKQFSVSNSMAAMKVGTDGVLLGAWCSVDDACRVLDVGTGTGLIALMVAQRNGGALIDALEIDPLASREAAHNVANSPWAGRITVMNRDFMEYEPAGCKYDLIVSNPPFYANGILPQDAGRMVARHCTALTYGGLLGKAASLLAPNGRICIVTPVEADECVTALAQADGLWVERKTLVRPKPGVKHKRILWQMGLAEVGAAHDELVIETERHHEYTAQYIDLTRDFYLKM